MKKMIIDFWKHLKEYVSVIFTLNFGELFVYVLELCLITIVGLLTYVPVGLVKDLLYTLISLFINNGGIIYVILDILFKLIALVCFGLTFIYCFNNRYNDLKKSEKEKKEQKNKEDNDIELPSMKK